MLDIKKNFKQNFQSEKKKHLSSFPAADFAVTILF